VALVNIEQWRQEKGFSALEASSNAPPAQGPSNSPPDPQLEALSQEIARQADLIRALQGALREYVDREERARLVAMNAARRSPTARVKRRSRAKPAPISPKSVV